MRGKIDANVQKECDPVFIQSCPRGLRPTSLQTISSSFIELDRHKKIFKFPIYADERRTKNNYLGQNGLAKTQ